MATTKKESLLTKLLLLPAFWVTVAIVISVFVLSTTYLSGVDKQIEFQTELIKIQIQLQGVSR